MSYWCLLYVTHVHEYYMLIACSLFSIGRVQKDDSGRPRGFGFVSFDAPASAQACPENSVLTQFAALQSALRLPLQGCALLSHGSSVYFLFCLILKARFSRRREVAEGRTMQNHEAHSKNAACNLQVQLKKGDEQQIEQANMFAC